jgi:hypothetical protein
LRGLEHSQRPTISLRHNFFNQEVHKGLIFVLTEALVGNFGLVDVGPELISESVEVGAQDTSVNDVEVRDLDFNR